MADLGVPPPPERRIGVAGVLESEWIKLRSVRSTYFSLLAAILMTIAIGAITAGAIVARWNDLGRPDRAQIDTAALSLHGVLLAQLAIGVLGVLVISSEYSTGMIRSTFTSVPQRRLALAAKGVVFALTCFVVGTVASFAAFFTSQAIFAQRSIQASLGAPHVLRMVVGGGLYLTVIGIFAFGLGALIRNTAGGIATLFGLLLVLPILTNVLPSPWNADVSRYLPLEAGTQVLLSHPDPTGLSTWWGFGVFCLWAAAAVLGAAVLVTRRDA